MNTINKLRIACFVLLLIAGCKTRYYQPRGLNFVDSSSIYAVYGDHVQVRAEVDKGRILNYFASPGAIDSINCALDNPESFDLFLIVSGRYVVRVNLYNDESSFEQLNNID